MKGDSSVGKKSRSKRNIQKGKDSVQPSNQQGRITISKVPEELEDQHK